MKGYRERSHTLLQRQNFFLKYRKKNLFLLTQFCDSYIFILTLQRDVFPDCVMVAPQILVLIVGVRILLGELRLTKSQLFFLA